jgi:hypothetical protein
MKSAELKERNYQFKTNINMKTKTSILALTKAFFILLVMCCFSSCTNELSKDSVFIVEEINLLNKHEALYTMTDRNKYGNWKFNIYFTDSINKFSVGDTVRLVK